MAQRGPFAHGEAELAEATGIALKLFQKNRAKNLLEGVDWAYVQGRVAYAPDAVGRVLEKITGRAVEQGAIAGVMLQVLEERSRITGAASKLVAIVTRFYPNPHLIQAQLPDGRAINIRVKENKNFRRGMEVPVRELPTRPGVYEVTRRLPRYAGRW